MVSNVYIDNVLRDFNNFKGTFSSDNIPYLFKNEAVICNLSRMDEEGSHFVLIFRKKEKIIYYFDPLKLGFIPEDIQLYLSQYNNIVKVKEISARIQGQFSKLCGFYCILVFLSINIGLRFWYEKVVVEFSHDYLENDKDCPDLINRLLPLSLMKNKLRNV